MNVRKSDFILAMLVAMSISGPAAASDLVKGEPVLSYSWGGSQSGTFKCESRGCKAELAAFKADSNLCEKGSVAIKSCKVSCADRVELNPKVSKLVCEDAKKAYKLRSKK